MATFEVVLAARTPQSATSPTLTAVDRLIVDNFTYTEELNRPGTANLGCPIRGMSDTVKSRLANLAANPSEVWIYADSALVWAGEIQTVQVQAQTASINAVGLLGYCYRMGVTADLLYGGTLAEDFEDTSYNVTPSGTWARSSTTSHGGTWSLRSAVIADNGFTDATFTVPAGATSVQFWYRASSEASFDFFQFYTPGTLQLQASGDTGWLQSASYPVTAGQTLTFRYIKDSAVAANLDAAFIDDLTFSGPSLPGVDQFTIAKGLVDHWQSQAFGNYGIDTSTVGTSGVTRTRVYLRNELHNIGQRVLELGAVDNGFDIKVDPLTRKLVLTYPQQGTDLSASVFLDERNIDNASVAMSVAPDDLVSDVSATGTGTTTGGSNFALYSAQTTSAVRTAYGRTWAGQNFDGVSVQATLDGHANAYLASRSAVLLQPGLTIVARVGSDIGDFHAGDTVTYSYDAGLGLQTTTRRVTKLGVSVSSNGQQRLRVEFN